MKHFICLLMLITITACGTVTKQTVQDMQATANAFDELMSEFVNNWATISGAIDGAYEGRTFPVPTGHVELKKEIDEIVGIENTPNTISNYEKGKIATLWASLVTAEVIRWLKEFRPEVLKLIPSPLLLF